jgi:CBS domain-containing protein
MRVQDVMTKSPKCCGANMNLAEAAALLWTVGCGALPVVDDAQHLIGIVTDRDICISVGTRNHLPSEIAVREVMSRNLATCRPDDEIHCALKTMRARKVRRLPVVSSDGILVGMLSMSELLLHARHGEGSRPELSDEDIMSTLRGICVHCPPRSKCA